MRRPSWWLRRFAQLVSIGALLGFTAFVVVQLREGFERRKSDPTSREEGIAEESEEVLSRGIEVTAWDAQGRLVEIAAEEAFGPSGGNQRFRGVEVRLPGVHQGEDAVIAADEMILGARRESLEFLGNAVLTASGLELAGDSLRFRPGPDRFWSSEPVLFVTSDFRGIASSFRFLIGPGEVRLSGVVAEPVDEGGFGAVAGQAAFDQATGQVTLGDEVELSSPDLLLTSREVVVLRRGREGKRLRWVEAGFGTRIRILADRHSEAEAPGAPGVVGVDSTEADTAFLLASDEVVVELSEGRTAKAVEFVSDARITGTESRIRGDRGRLDLDPDGSPTLLRLEGGTSAELPIGSDGRIARVRSERLETGFSDRDRLGSARFQGRVEASYGRATATGQEAVFDGEETMVLTGGSPRVSDPSLMEIEGARVSFRFRETGELEVEGGASARFLPDRLDWLPGSAAAAGVTSETAVMDGGSGRGTFRGGVRLLFGANLLGADLLEVDAEVGTLRASGKVRSSFAFAAARAAESVPDIPPLAENPGSRTSVGGPSEPHGPGAAAEPFRFEGRAERFSYEAETARFSYEGSPEIERRQEETLTLVRAARVLGEIGPDGVVVAVVGENGARFSRDAHQVSGSRIRYEPETDRLHAWGAPAIADFDGKTTRGGRLDLDLGEDRSEVYPTQATRAFVRVKLKDRSDDEAAPRGARPERSRRQ